MDVVRECPFVQLHGRLLQDVFGASHTFYHVEAPPLNAASIVQLCSVQQCLTGLLELLPDSIAQIQWIQLPRLDTDAQLAEFAAFKSRCPAVDTLRAERLALIRHEADDELRPGSECVVVLSWLPPEACPSDPGRSPSLCALSEASSDAAADSLSVAEALLRERLSTIAARVHSMDEREIGAFFHRTWNPGCGDADHGFDPAADPFVDAWICSDWTLLPDCWRIGEWFHGFVSLEAKPRCSFPRIIERLTTRCSVARKRVILSLRRPERQQEQAEMRARRDRALRRMREPGSILDRIIRPEALESPELAHWQIEARSEVEEANGILEEWRTGAEVPCVGQLVVHCWAESAADLRGARSTIAAAIGDMEQARAVCETHGTREVFRSTLPGSLCGLPRWLKMRSRMAADLVPLHHGWRTGERPRVLLRTVEGSLLAMDLFDRTNVQAPMVFVSGRSGSGKSFLVNQLLLQNYLESTRVLILDIGGSYEKLTRLLGGDYRAFDPASPLSVNVMTSLTAGSQDRGDVVRVLCEMMECTATTTLSAEVIAAVDGAAEKLAFDVAASSRAATLDDLRDILQRRGPAGAEAAARLEPFTSGGRYGPWFRAAGELDFSNPFICIDLKRLLDDPVLSRAMAVAILHRIHQMMREFKSDHKIIVMDEMWDFLRNKRMSEFVVEAWKTFRKENVVVLGISQSLGGDVASRPAISSAILQNTETWFLFDQGGPDETCRTAELLSLTEGQREILQGLSAGGSGARRALFIRGHRGNVPGSTEIRVEASAKEYWLATSDPADAAKFADALRSSDGDVLTALDAHVAKIGRVLA